MAGSQVRADADPPGPTLLPAPESLAEISLPGFRLTHPRLPHPSPQDILRPHNQNPQWLEQMRGLADGGRGALNATITMAYIEPGSQDLALLHQRLQGLQYRDRGHQQASR